MHEQEEQTEHTPCSELPEPGSSCDSASFQRAALVHGRHRRCIWARRCMDKGHKDGRLAHDVVENRQGLYFERSWFVRSCIRVDAKELVRSERELLRLASCKSSLVDQLAHEHCAQMCCMYHSISGGNER